MKRALPLESISRMNETDIQILRVISLKLGDREKARIEYQMIADSLQIKRDVVRCSVNRLVKNRILKRDEDGLSFVNDVIIQ